MFVVSVNGVGTSGNVEVAEEETSDKHIEPHVRVMISSCKACNACLSSCWLNEMPWGFVTCRSPPQGCLWCSRIKSNAQR